MNRNRIVLVDDLRQMRLDFEAVKDVLGPSIELHLFDNAKTSSAFIERYQEHILGVITDFWILQDESDNSTGDPRYDHYPYAMDLLRELPSDLPAIIYTRFRAGTFKGSTEEYLDEARALLTTRLDVQEFHIDSAPFLKQAVKQFERFWVYDTMEEPNTQSS